MSKLRIGSVWYKDGFFSDALDAEQVLISKVDDLTGLDLLVFWGGQDIHPRMYKEKNEYSHVAGSLERDKWESFIFEKALMYVPIVGICRGAQLACVMTGGKLWQDVVGHGRDHNIKMADGTIVRANSTHHQMMIPSAETEVLAVSEEILSPTKYNEKGPHVVDADEPEICFNSLARCLMIQGHPEYGSSPKEFKELTLSLIDKYLGVSK